MADSKSAPETIALVGKTMDELARQIGATDPDDPLRKILLTELSELTRVRVWLRSETNKLSVEKADEFTRELTRLQIGDRQRVEVMTKILRLIPSLKEH